MYGWSNRAYCLPAARYIHRLVCLVALIWGGPVYADTLTIPGSGAPEVLLKALAAVFNQSQQMHAVEVPPSIGSTGGIKAVIAGNAVLARVARPLKPDETGLMYKPFARDAVVFVTGEKTGVSELNTGQLVDIYSGHLSTWQQVGGTSTPIRLLTRESTETSLGIIKKHIAPFQTLAIVPQAKLANRDFEMLELLEKYQTSIGWLTRSTVTAANTMLNIIALDGVEPSIKTVQSGAYPLIGDYAFVYRPDQLTTAAEQFMAFISSDAGREVLEQLGAAGGD